MTTRCARRSLSAIATVLILLTAMIASAAEPILKEGDRMVFLGDSITQQRIYSRYVMDYFALRHPDLQVTFRNAGVGGDTAIGAIKRLDKDVLEARPDVVSICFGMNDAGYSAFDEKRYQSFMAGMEVLVSELNRAGVATVLLTPGPVDPDEGRGSTDWAGYNEVLRRYADGVKEIAAREGLPVHDIHALLLDVQTRAKAADPEFTMIPDAVHPSPAGHALMAYGLLAAMGCEGAASALLIDARTGAVAAENCSVENLRLSDAEITFTRKDDGLPTYFDAEVAAIIPHAPLLEELNRYVLTVTGLEAGTWDLTVEGLQVGSFTSEALAEGVDLAGQPGPWQDLAKAVNDTVADQESIWLQRRQLTGVFRWISALPPEAEVERLALVKKLDETVSARDRAIAALVSDRTWEWRLARAP